MQAQGRDPHIQGRQPHGAQCCNRGFALPGPGDQEAAAASPGSAGFHARVPALGLPPRAHLPHGLGLHRRGHPHPGLPLPLQQAGGGIRIRWQSLGHGSGEVADFRQGLSRLAIALDEPPVGFPVRQARMMGLPRVEEDQAVHQGRMGFQALPAGVRAIPVEGQRPAQRRGIVVLPPRGRLEFTRFQMAQEGHLGGQGFASHQAQGAAEQADPQAGGGPQAGSLGNGAMDGNRSRAAREGVQHTPDPAEARRRRSRPRLEHEVKAQIPTGQLVSRAIAADLQIDPEIHGGIDRHAPVHQGIDRPQIKGSTGQVYPDRHPPALGLRGQDRSAPAWRCALQAYPGSRPQDP